jgi:hypothetical protein
VATTHAEEWPAVEALREGGSGAEQGRGGGGWIGRRSSRDEGRQWIWKRSRGGGGWTLEAAEMRR